VSEPSSTIELTAEVVASYLSNHQIPVAEVPALIRAIYRAFSSEPDAAGAPGVSGPTKTQIRKSVAPDTIVSFEDGRGYKLLRRHLAKFGLTPAAYRTKWGLPSDYPMVAPAYAAERSVLAKARGLGRRPAKPSPAPVPDGSDKAGRLMASDPPKARTARPPRSKKSGA
jgi:predicted transcriptional regulator